MNILTLEPKFKIVRITSLLRRVELWLKVELSVIEVSPKSTTCFTVKSQ